MAILEDLDTRAVLGVSESLGALIALHTLTVDTQRGFTKMVEKAHADFRPVADRFSALHGRHIGRLANMVREMGGQPDADGSFMGTINSTVVSLRAVFGTIDIGVMDQIRSGEQNLLAAFALALRVSLPKGHHEALAQMQGELTQLLHETRHLG